MLGKVVSSYTEYLRAQGETVIKMKGIWWMKHNGALIPAESFPVYVDLTRSEIVAAMKETGALFLRYAIQSNDPVTNWWNVVCREYNFNRASSNTRSKVRRGLNRLEICQKSPEWLAEHGYDCHVVSYSRYYNASPLTREEFRSFLLSMQGQVIFDVWTCSLAGELLGYVLCLHEAEGIFTHTVDVTPKGLKNYAAYALFHKLLDYYVNEIKIPVSNGSRSIAHATEMQEFLGKFGFKREYSKLSVVYRPDIALIVRLLFPIRGVLKHMDRIPLVHKVSAVLFQEEIARGLAGVPT